MQRGWHVDGQSVRPDHRMVAHTGFLTTARLLGPLRREPPRRRSSSRRRRSRRTPGTGCGFAARASSWVGPRGRARRRRRVRRRRRPRPPRLDAPHPAARLRSPSCSLVAIVGQSLGVALGSVAAPPPAQRRRDPHSPTGSRAPWSASSASSSSCGCSSPGSPTRPAGRPGPCAARRSSARSTHVAPSPPSSLVVPRAASSATGRSPRCSADLTAPTSARPPGHGIPAALSPRSRTRS